MRKAKITEVYLEEERWNHVCQATIPAAWVAIVDGFKQAIGRPWDFKNEQEARAEAKRIFSGVSHD